MECVASYLAHLQSLSPRRKPNKGRCAMIRHQSRWLRITWAAWLGLMGFSAGGRGYPAFGAESGQIRWREDYAAALDEAKSAGRPLWIQFTGPWCPHCTRMERDSFPAPAIIQHADETFIPLKLRSDVHQQLAVSFNLSGIPASIVVSPNLEILAFQQGYLGPAELDAFLNAAAARGELARRQPQPNSREAALRVEKRSSDAKVKTDPNPGPNRNPSSDPKLSLRGYCPVSLVRDRKLVVGDAAFAVEQEGRVYRFAKLELADEFRKSPQRFIPWKDGTCPVTETDSGKTLPGSPKWGVIYQNRLFLCASAEARLQFVKAPERYAPADGAERFGEMPAPESGTRRESTEAPNQSHPRAGTADRKLPSRSVSPGSS
jgi:YHS domain-containing protein/thiol-disulfide isomerase/thioredoxin